MTKRPIAPDAPPPLKALTARKEGWEADRAVVYPKWKAALDAAHGNVTHAAMAYQGVCEPANRTDRKRLADFGRRLARRFDMLEYARRLRLVSTGKDTGRPIGKRKSDRRPPT